MQIKLIFTRKVFKKGSFPSKILPDHYYSRQYYTININYTLGGISTINRGDTKSVLYWDQPFLVGWADKFFVFHLERKTVFGFFG